MFIEWTLDKEWTIPDTESWCKPIISVINKRSIIKNHFEVFLVTSKKHGNGIIESKVGLYSIKASSHIFVS
jgi:hypothetical protein